MTSQDRARQARNAYQRKWRAKNPEKVRAIMERYWGKKAEQQQKQDDSRKD